MKQVTGWIGKIIIGAVVLLVILAGLLYVHPIQNFVAKKTAAYVSKASGMHITFEEIHLTPLLDLDLKELQVSLPEKELLSVKRSVVDLDLMHLLQGRIGIEEVALIEGSVNTQNLFPQFTLAGKLKKLQLSTDEVNLKKHTIELAKTTFDGCQLDIALRDTTTSDTKETANSTWKIDSEAIAITKSKVKLTLPGDSIMLQTRLEKACISGIDLDTSKEIYKVEKLSMDAPVLKFDNKSQPPQPEERIDYNHLNLKYIHAEANDICYTREGNNVSCEMSAFSMAEQCGLKINNLTTNLHYNDHEITLKDLQLKTPSSELAGSVKLEWNALDTLGTGQMDVDINGEFGKQDLVWAVGNYIPQDVTEVYPDKPLSIHVKTEGNVRELSVKELAVSMPEVIDIQTEGKVLHITESEKIEGQMKWDIVTRDLSMVTRYAKLKDVRVPPMHIEANTTLTEGKKVVADATMHERKGQLNMKGQLDIGTKSYEAKASAKGLQIHDFLPKDSIYSFNGSGRVKGQGWDFTSPSTRAEAHVVVESVQYKQLTFEDLTLVAQLKDGKGMMEMESNNDMLTLSACAEANMGKRVDGLTFSMDLSQIDLYALGFAKDTLRTSMILNIEGSSNLCDTHEVKGSIQAIELMTKDSIFHPLDLFVSASLNPESVNATATAGDLDIEISSIESIDSILTKYHLFRTELERELGNYHLSQDTLTTLLPNLNVHVRGGRKNPICNFLYRMTGYSFEHMNFVLDSDNERGLNGYGNIQSLNTGSVLLDTITWNITQDSTNVSADLRVKNGPKNKVASFESLAHADLTPSGANVNLQFKDAKGKKGVDLGLTTEMTPEGMIAHFTPLNPTIAYRHFSINENNFIELTTDGRVQALVDLLADDGTGMKLYSTPNEDALQDISLSVNNFNLGELSKAIPYCPDIRGFLHGDIHYVQMDSTLSVSTDLGVKEMVYEGTKVGNIGLNAVYLPNADGSHYVDGIMTQNDEEILYLSGKYFEIEKKGQIDANATLNHLPLNLVDGYIPDRMAGLRGYVNGDLAVRGSTSNPILDGALSTDSMYLISDMYSINLRFEDDTIHINQSKINLDRIKAYSLDKNPMTIDGTIDCQNVDRINVNLAIQAKNYQLINAPKTKDAIAYGKVNVDMNGMMRGTLNDLRMFGRLTVLGNTNVTYVLKDSPLTVEDRLAELVTFTDFSDTTQVETPVPIQKQNVDMQLNISIEQAAQVHCLLSEDGSDYVRLEGGGDLSMSYSTQNGLKLNGRYTINSGDMSYTLMSVVCKNFTLKNGSYVEFTGDMMNPRLNISATERVKASYNQNNTSRTVTFDVGLNITQTLENMGLEFTLEAPEDMSVQNELASMSSEERGRVAVTMLATNMFITDLTDTSGFSTANALNSFLQSEINNLVGRTQNTIDVNFGIEDNTSQSGSNQTDYSFSFAKRFWGNRIRLVIGGKVSTGKDAVNTGETIIDNISLEYRLDRSATRYVKVYYNRNYESLLEGELTEMGAGVVFRRKSSRLADLFRFRTREKEIGKEGKP